ncbi:MAG: ATP phosphoribosyltransferase regulatory subunit [Gammaproteobacteria bacterium]|nr:ATP phosphoribosyltransferase regulatory subunit [Gammaproteobacteria bacterium]
MRKDHWLLPEGIDELLPPQAMALEQLRRELLDLHDSWGYELISPPFVEYLESLLTGTGSDLDLRTFKLTDQITGRTLGIRADITPQAARIDAHQLRREAPTRLCYVGNALNTRNDSLAGSRSPLQMGAELYGHRGVEADQEIICLMLETLNRAGVDDLYMDLGHVGIFTGLIAQSGASSDQEMALFDALQRKAIPELESLVDEYQLAEAGEMIVSLAVLSGDDVLTSAKSRLAAADESVHHAITDLEQVALKLATNRPQIPLHFDLSELRGYHYHTGLVFAAYVPGKGHEVARGGRYDDIGKLFGRARPACGFSTDLKALFAMGKGTGVKTTGLIYAPVDDDPVLKSRIEALRTNGRRVVRGLKGQQSGAAELGCSEALVKQGSEWIIATV